MKLNAITSVTTQLIRHSRDNDYTVTDYKLRKRIGYCNAAPSLSPTYWFFWVQYFKVSLLDSLFWAADGHCPFYMKRNYQSTQYILCSFSKAWICLLSNLGCFRGNHKSSNWTLMCVVLQPVLLPGAKCLGNLMITRKLILYGGPWFDSKLQFFSFL